MKKIISFVFLPGVILAFSLIDAVTINAASSRQVSGVNRQIPAAPDFTLKDLQGNDVALGSFRGRKVLLVFGATWCSYCVAEVKELNAFYDKHQDKDVKIINVDIRESAGKVAGFVKKYNIKYTVLLDVDGEVAGRYNVYGIPMIFFIDENGIIKYSGGIPKDGLDALLK